MQKIIAALGTEKKTVTVIGGGSIGLEVAENLAKANHHVRILERAKRLAMNFDKEMADYIHEKAIDEGIELELNHEIIGFSGDKDGHVTGIRTNLTECPTDIVIVAVGVRPNTDFCEIPIFTSTTTAPFV